jgi:hypothetical protein
MVVGRNRKKRKKSLINFPDHLPERIPIQTKNSHICPYEYEKDIIPDLAIDVYMSLPHTLSAPSTKKKNSFTTPTAL